MMKVSTKSTYAIRALVDLARSSQEHPERLASIADRQNIPLPFLEQIFSKLKNAGLVQAVRGPQGGYTLAKKPDDVSLADIVTVLEGPIEPVLCSQPHNKSENCHQVDGCMSRHVCSELDGAVYQILASNTVGKLLLESERLGKRTVEFS